MAAIFTSITLPSTPAAAKAAGAKRYFTGIPCNRGHIAERYACGAACVECVKERAERWQADNPEKVRAADRSWKETNRHKILNDLRAKRAANPEKYREADRKWRANNLAASRNSKRETMKIWRTNNPGQMLEVGRLWRAANKEKVRAYTRNRHALKMSAEGFHTGADISRIRVAQRDRCANPTCRKNLKGRGDVDHIRPLSKGGSNWPRNLQLLCPSCNRSKHARDQIEFMQNQGLLL